MRLDDCSEFLHKQLNIPVCKCQICHKELPKNGFVNIPHYIICDVLMNPEDYFVEWPKSEKQAFINVLSESAYVKTVRVCHQCYEGLFHEYLSNEARRSKTQAFVDALSDNHKLPIYINGEYQGEVYAEPYRKDDMLEGCCIRKDDMVDSARWTYEKLQNERKILKFKLEERKMKNVNETKTHAFAIERNYDETDRKLFRLEDAETGDFIRLATDEEKRIYMVVNIAPVKNRVKVNEKSGSNCVWCVCIQTQDLVELNGDDMVYVYDPRYIAFRIGRFIDA